MLHPFISFCVICVISVITPISYVPIGGPPMLDILLAYIGVLLIVAAGTGGYFLGQEVVDKLWNWWYHIKL